ncbi:MAG TPA: radical SAM protein [Stellaceae bacterium]|nr:radical SAM protein [Stellaceae bacterium]
MRPLNILAVQLGFNNAYPDVSTAATTYNDGIYYVASFVKRTLENARLDMCQMLWGENPLDRPIEQYDYFLISALATQFWSNIEVLKEIRRRRKKGSTVIIGGPHAAFAPHEALEYAEFAVIAEGEIPTVEIIEALETGGDPYLVKNIAFIDGDGFLKINQCSRYPSIDNAIDPTLLASAPKLHWATVSMSRGCPFDCSFCYAIRLLGRQFRTKSIEDITAELDGIYRQTGCSRFYVTDLNFTTRRDFCDAVANAVMDRGYKFIAMSRIDHADNIDLVRKLHRAGFEEYCLGVESEDPKVLTAFNKKVDPTSQTERLRRFAENNVNIHSAIIFGLEMQDNDAVLATARWCADARIVHPTFVCLAEYPFQKLLFGSRQDIEDHRIIMQTPTFQHYSFVGIYPRHMRPSVLQRLILQSYDVFFERAMEVETRPQRRMRIKAYERSIAQSQGGMERHVAFLEELERPYYTASGTLKEDLLKADFEARFGKTRAWLAQTARGSDPQFVKAYAR